MGTIDKQTCRFGVHDVLEDGLLRWSLHCYFREVMCSGRRVAFTHRYISRDGPKRAAREAHRTLERTQEMGGKKGADQQK